MTFKSNDIWEAHTVISLYAVTNAISGKKYARSHNSRKDVNIKLTKLLMMKFDFFKNLTEMLQLQSLATIRILFILIRGIILVQSAGKSIQMVHYICFLIWAFNLPITKHIQIGNRSLVGMVIKPLVDTLIYRCLMMPQPLYF